MINNTRNKCQECVKDEVTFSIYCRSHIPEPIETGTLNHLQTFSEICLFTRRGFLVFLVSPACVGYEEVDDN